MIRYELFAPENMPEVTPGTEIAVLIAEECRKKNFALQSGDVVVLAQKIVSKAEGRLISLASVTPGEQAIRIAEKSNKDPRLVELILCESRTILRVQQGLIVPETKLGLVTANAGIDSSNTGGEPDLVILLPSDPDQSAREIAQRLFDLTGVRIGVVINDSQGRPFRNGAIGVAIGCAGVNPLKVYIGEKDRDSKTLQSSVEAVADEIASAASLLMGQAAEGRPLVIIRGLAGLAGSGKAAELIREPEQDFFR